MHVLEVILKNNDLNQWLKTENDFSVVYMIVLFRWGQSAVAKYCSVSFSIVTDFGN